MILLYCLKEAGIVVDKCVIVTEFSIKRFRHYYYQLDKKELTKKIRDRILGNITNLKVSDEVKYIEAEYKKAGLKNKKISDYCRENGIKYKIVGELNDQATLQFIDGADLGIYSGGGIIKKKLLGKFKIGILNCHSGKLPEVRGMNSNEWSTLLNIPYYNTLHFMVREIDLGPIIELIPHDYSSCDNIDKLRGQAVVYAVQDLVHGTKKIIANEYTLSYQKKEDGKQYFIMHPIFKSIVNTKLVSYNGEDI
jgi:hypothetical protein